MIMPGRGNWIGLSACCAILSGIIAFEIVGPASEPSVRSAAQVADVQAAPTAAPLDQRGGRLNDLLARPLFSPDRKPVGTGDVRGLPRLTGIIISDTARLAIFASATGDRSVVREAGMLIGVYEVKEVGETGVTVTGPGGTSVIRTLFDTGPAPAKRPPPPRPEPVRGPAK